MIRRIIAIVLAVMVGFSAMGCMSGNKNESGEVDMDTASKWDSIEDAYAYCFPLVLMDATATVSTNTEKATAFKAPVNQFIHSDQLADADTRAVVTPNVDTLYTQVFFDLGEDAFVFYKPAADRFLSIEILDFYTNSTAILGTGGDTQDERTYLIAGPSFAGEVPKNMTLVEIPTENAWMIIRTVVYDEADIANVKVIQEDMKLVPYKEYQTSGYEYVLPEGSFDQSKEFVPIEHVLSMSPEEFFTKANNLMLTNQPTEADKEILAEMSELGVGPGLKFDEGVLGEDGGLRWKEMLLGIEASWSGQSEDFFVQQGSWSFYGKPIACFGTEYAYRALIALGGLGANPVEVAIYPKAGTDGEGNALSGENNYVIHFDKEDIPPVDEFGFWSITAYGDNNFLIDNKIDRYLINDRSNLVYNDDGSLDIYVQTDSPEDGSLQGNWLPAGEEGFHLVMRIYLPQESVIEGSWSVPSIDRTSL